MILVDSSVIIPFLRTKDAKLGGLFQTLPVAVCGVTRAEILHGVRSAADRAQTIQFLSAFGAVGIPGTLWDVVGDNLNLLRRSGVTIQFNDVVVATVAIDVNKELWARDAHFTLIQSVLPALKLYSEPP